MDPNVHLEDWAQLSQKNHRLLIKRVRSDIIASSWIVNPPFGKKKSVYADFFASSKPLKKFESVMAQEVLPYYANTHTTSTSTSRTTSQSVRLARGTIARCTRANTTPGHEHEAVVIFCGDGSTSAINKVRNVFRLGDEAYWIRKALATFSALSVQAGPSANVAAGAPKATTTTAPHSFYFHSLPAKHRPVVFLSIQEHHSNLLPWRESCADVIVIPEDGFHRLDLQVLEQRLVEYQDRPLKLGTFSAGSNLTGVLNDTIAISELLHKYGAYAFFDYAGVGPYTTIDMNPPASSSSTTTAQDKKNLAYKDGVFISTHKFLGGPGASGVLIARSEIFSWADRNSADSDRDSYSPANPGGGTVDMVIQGRHKYSNNIIAREEAGTPNILATIKTGLVFRLQELVDPAWILQKEYKLSKRVMARLQSPSLHQAIRILGASDQDRVAVFSLTIAVPDFVSNLRQAQSQAHGREKAPTLQIHYALLSTIMNDFFGIEMRGGCMCAGPYASQLLQLDAAKESAFWKLLLGEVGPEEEETQQRKKVHQQDLCSKSLKPGFVRFSFSYFARDKDVEFVLQSLEWVAQFGYLLVPLYKLDPRSGEWSVREAVRNAVYQESSPRRLMRRSRDACIPVAVDCIYGLKKLFREQKSPARLWKASWQAQPRPGSIREQKRIADNNSFSDGNDYGVSVFSSLGQARRSLSNALSEAFHRTPKITISSNPPWPATTTSRWESSTVKNDAVSSTIMHSVHDKGMDVESSTSGSEISSVFSEVRTIDPTETHREQEPVVTMSSSSLDCEDMMATTAADKKSILLPSERRFSAKNRRIIEEALEELSYEKLEREVEAIEDSPLAKELRWFVTPWEVAQVYSRHSAHRLECPSPFPKR